MRLKAAEARVEDYPFLDAGQMRRFQLVSELQRVPPSVPQLTVPQPTDTGLFPMNHPGRDSLVIVTGNSHLTMDVLATVWAHGNTPAHFLVVDSQGSTVDMAVIYGTFTPGRLKQAVEESGLERQVSHRRMIVPGFTAPLANGFAETTGWTVEVGPVCALELPLFLGERWVFP